MLDKLCIKRQHYKLSNITGCTNLCQTYTTWNKGNNVPVSQHQFHMLLGDDRTPDRYLFALSRLNVEGLYKQSQSLIPSGNAFHVPTSILF